MKRWAWNCFCLFSPLLLAGSATLENALAARRRDPALHPRAHARATGFLIILANLNLFPALFQPNTQFSQTACAASAA